MRILIAEDDSIIADGLSRSLRQAGYAVDWAPHGLEADAALASASYDLLILDLGLPKMPGLEVLKRLRARNSQLPVLILTALDGTVDRVKGLDLGADDYMVKPFNFRELLARVRVLQKRRAVAKVDVAKEISYADLCINLERQEVTRNGEPVKLSPKEYNLLVYLVENAEKVVSRVEIAEKVWNTHFDTGTNFIDVYINYLRKKMDKNFEVKLIHTKPGVGFILTDKM